MNEQTVEHALVCLEKLTGLKLSISGLSPEKEAEAARQLTRLSTAYREIYDKDNFLKNVLKGTISGSDLAAGAARFHLPVTGGRVLYVIEVKPRDAQSALKILRQMFITHSGDFAFAADSRRLALIKTDHGEEDREETAHTIVDILNTDGMIRARAAYGKVLASPDLLAQSFRESSVALEIGRTFYSGRTVLSYERLGIGRLIYRLPEETSRQFLTEVFGDRNPEELDDETIGIINAFFENNLNISETARQLYIHRNTLVYRLEKIRQLTGLDLRNFDDAVELKIAMMVASCLRAGSKGEDV